MKFLIDECLSPQLASFAHQRGYEASHVNWLGGSGTKDWDLVPLIAEGDWTFVTCNSADFRGSAASPGDKGQYRRLDVHAGLICLNAKETITRALQLELFEVACDELGSKPDLINQVLEISLEAGEIRITRYDLPRPQQATDV